MPILEWYFEVERPEAMGQKARSEAADRCRPDPVSSATCRLPSIAVVPKGLRSFDANDADFFLRTASRSS